MNDLNKDQFLYIIYLTYFNKLSFQVQFGKFVSLRNTICIAFDLFIALIRQTCLLVLEMTFIRAIIHHSNQSPALNPSSINVSVLLLKAPTCNDIIIFLHLYSNLIKIPH